MFFKIKSNVMFRNYNSFGYITDNRNFGYKRSDDTRNDIGDKILSESGSVFLSVLGKEAESLNELAARIGTVYSDIDSTIIKKDAEEFYCNLEKSGFIVSGQTPKECEEKDKGFSYTRPIDSNWQNSRAENIIESEKSTQDYFVKYYNDKPQLTSLHIELTSKCNEQCIHCYIPHEYKESSIDSHLFYEILRQSEEMRLLHFTLSGGEPMLHNNFLDFLKACRDKQFSISVLSNLTILNDTIVKEMKANPLLGVQVSLYSMNAQIHDGITQRKGSFERTKSGILKLIENDIPLKISCPILKQNKDCYQDVIKWAQQHKILMGNDYVILARYNHTTKNLDHRLSIDEVEDVINDLAKQDNEFMVHMEIEAEKKRKMTENDYICSVCQTSICIADNGNVHPCAGWQDYTVGNIKDTHLKDIWNNSDRVNYLRSLRRKDFPKCLSCPDNEYCTMCMVRNANEDPNGNPLSVNEFFCSVAKINRTIMDAWKLEQIQ